MSLSELSHVHIDAYILHSHKILLYPSPLSFLSLNSVSNSIRWSTDYRLHRTKARKRGKADSDLDWFYGLKDSLPLRGSNGADLGSAVDWAQWANVERTKVQDSDKGIGTASV